MTIDKDKKESWEVRVNSIDFAHRNKKDNFYIKKSKIKNFYKIKEIIDAKNNLNEEQDAFLNDIFIDLIATNPGGY